MRGGPGSTLDQSCESRVGEKEKELPALRHRSSGMQSREARETLLTGRLYENENSQGRCSGIQYSTVHTVQYRRSER